MELFYVLQFSIPIRLQLLISLSLVKSFHILMTQYFLLFCVFHVNVSRLYLLWFLFNFLKVRFNIKP